MWHPQLAAGQVGGTSKIRRKVFWDNLFGQRAATATRPGASSIESLNLLQVTEVQRSGLPQA